MRNVFYYYDQFGEVCCGKAPVDEGIIVGGQPEGLIKSFSIKPHEAELTLDQLRRLYPYDRNTSTD